MALQKLTKVGRKWYFHHLHHSDIISDWIFAEDIDTIGFLSRRRIVHNSMRFGLLIDQKWWCGFCMETDQHGPLCLERDGLFQGETSPSCYICFEWGWNGADFWGTDTNRDTDWDTNRFISVREIQWYQYLQHKFSRWWYHCGADGENLIFLPTLVSFCSAIFGYPRNVLMISNSIYEVVLEPHSVPFGWGCLFEKRGPEHGIFGSGFLIIYK